MFPCRKIVRIQRLHEITILSDLCPTEISGDLFRQTVIKKNRCRGPHHFPCAKELFLYKQVPAFTFHDRPLSRCSFLPFTYILAVMLKGKAVFSAEIPVAVLAMKRKVNPLTTESTVLMDGWFFLSG